MAKVKTIEKGFCSLCGKPCALEFSGKNLACEAGDLIVKD